MQMAANASAIMAAHEIDCHESGNCPMLGEIPPMHMRSVLIDRIGDYVSNAGNPLRVGDVTGAGDSHGPRC